MTFQRLRVNKPGKNVFDLSHEKKTSFNMGYLVPCYLQDVIPGDRFRVNSEIFIRFAPILAPVMHRVNVFIHFFFVPNRLVWTNWENFITGGTDGLFNTPVPTIYISDGIKAWYEKGKLPDYMGIPITNGLTVTQNVYFSELPFRAYQLIYNEFYRDQNLTTPIAIPTGDSSNYQITTLIKNRCWEKDYFTSCLPWTQRGGEVNLPVEGEIGFIPEYLSQSDVKLTGGGTPTDGGIASASGKLHSSGAEDIRIENLALSTSYELENVSITVNELRQSVRLQEWLERNARGGARYIEQILSHFGVVSSDARLRRPEYLGGGKAPVVISEVLATADSGSYDPGYMTGKAISVGESNSFERFFEEHGYIIGIISVLPRTGYQQGIENHFLKTNKLDFYFPEFALLGEQAVKNVEVYWDHTGTKVATDTFGYQSRYAEYKFKQSQVHGDFRDSLSYWHMNRIFTSGPTLNTSFVEADPTARIFMITTPAVHKIYAQIFHQVKAVRPMPKFADPIL